VAAGKDLVEKGILRQPQPNAVLALHVWPGFPAGTICSKPGVLMAASDLFKLIIHGKGGHGSKPDQAIDPILIASRLINSLYQIPSRKLRAMDAVVFSVCKIQGGFNANVIPDEVELEGTVRYLSNAVGEKIPALFESVVKNECEAFGATYTLNYARPYLATVNDTHIVNTCKFITKDFIGITQWLDLEEPVMSSEDFSYYLDKQPGAMFFLGNGENCPPLHSPYFDFNDEALLNGILFLVLSTLTFLGRGIKH
jgi:amidohydrolase